MTIKNIIVVSIACLIFACDSKQETKTQENPLLEMQEKTVNRAQEHHDKLIERSQELEKIEIQN